MAFLAGDRPGNPGLKIEPVPSLVVLVGPNNSGKSVALRELRSWAAGEDPVRKVFAELTATWPESYEEAAELLKPFRRSGPPPGQSAQAGFDYYHFPDIDQAPSHGDRVVRPEDLARELASPAQNSQQLRSMLLSPLAMRLDGQTRFNLSANALLGDRQEAPSNHLSALFRDDSARKQLRAKTFRAFRRYAVIEPVGDGHLRFRMSRRQPTDPDEEQGLTSRATLFHSEAELLTDQGDGMRAMVGLLSAVMSLPHRLLLIDEPEAFLHPPLARRLGQDLAELIAGREGTLVAATHSAEFLGGCLDAGVDATVIRMTYDGEHTATARPLPASDLKQLMREPLVRSARVLNGLFHRGVIVVEGDSDRVFYEEVNFRLRAVDRGAADSLFINAHSWQTTGSIAAPLRRLGVPAAIVLDLDALVRGGGEWGSVWGAVGTDTATLAELKRRRSECEALLRATSTEGDPKPFKRLGLGALKNEAAALVREHLDAFRKVGIFLVPVGEVEGWLSSLQVTGKSTWVERVFEAMGSDPDLDDYVRPSGGDVWQFLDEIESWIADPARDGVDARQ